MQPTPSQLPPSQYQQVVTIVGIQGPNATNPPGSTMFVSQQQHFVTSPQPSLASYPPSAYYPPTYNPYSYCPFPYPPQLPMQQPLSSVFISTGQPAAQPQKITQLFKQTIEEELKIEGDVEATESTIDSISATGSIKLTNTNIKKDVTGHENVTILKSKIDGSLSCSSRGLIIENSEITTLIIKGQIIPSYTMISSGPTIVVSGSHTTYYPQGLQQDLNERKIILNASTIKKIVFEGALGQVCLKNEAHVNELVNCTIVP